MMLPWASGCPIGRSGGPEGADGGEVAVKEVVGEPVDAAAGTVDSGKTGGPEGGTMGGPLGSADGAAYMGGGGWEASTVGEPPRAE